MAWNSTIKVKTKPCKSCGAIRKIYARGLCGGCYMQEQNEKQRDKIKNSPPKKRAPIKKFSNKMTKELAKYRKLRDEYMAEHPICEFKNCTSPSTDLHHKSGRGPNLCNVDTFMAVCRKDHNWIHENDKEAREMGYLLTRIGN